MNGSTTVTVPAISHLRIITPDLTRVAFHLARRAGKLQLQFERWRSGKRAIYCAPCELLVTINWRLIPLVGAESWIQFPRTDQAEANVITGSRVIRCAIVRRSRLSNVQGHHDEHVLISIFCYAASSVIWILPTANIVSIIEHSLWNRRNRCDRNGNSWIQRVNKCSRWSSVSQLTVSAYFVTLPIREIREEAQAPSIARFHQIFRVSMGHDGVGPDHREWERFLETSHSPEL